MKYKILLFILGNLIISSFGAIAISESENTTQILIDNTHFLQPKITQENEFTILSIPNIKTTTFEPNKPILPVLIKEFTFPFGTKINEIKVSFLNTIDIHILKPLPSASELQPSSKIYQSKQDLETVKIEPYSDIQIYPENRYNFKTGTGIKNGQHFLFLM